MTKSMCPTEDADKAPVYEVACQVRNHLTGKPCGHSATQRLTVTTSRRRASLDACADHIRTLRALRGVVVEGSD